MKKYVTINGYKYVYYSPDDYIGKRNYEKQVKRVKEKIRASQNGCYKNCISGNGKPYYNDYVELLNFLEKLI